MKTWNAPEVQELNINETANGILNGRHEVWFIENTNKLDQNTNTNTDTDKDKITPES